MPQKTDRRRSLAVFFAPVVTAVLMGLVWVTDFARELENVTIDWRYRARAKDDPPPDPRIALVGIGDYSLKEWGRWQDWSRQYHAVFLEALSLRPPKVVAYDFFFSEQSADQEADLAFADALATTLGAVTGVEVIQEESDPENPASVDLHNTLPLKFVSGDIGNLLGGNDANAPVEIIAQSSWTGVVNFPPSKIDGMRRKLPLVARIGKEVYPSFVLQVMMQLEGASSDAVRVELGKHVIVPKADGGEWRIPIDEGGYYAVNYRNTDRFVVADYVFLAKELAATTQGVEWREDLPPLENQIVIIGQSAVGLSDFGATPYSAQDPLFKVQATALDSILRSDHLKQAHIAGVLGGWVVIAWLTLLCLRQAPISVEIGVPVLLSLLYIGLSFLLFHHFSYVLPIVLPIVGFVLIHTTIIADRLMIELREKRYIQAMFGSYVSPEVVRQIVTSGRTPELGGEKVYITILFSDIQGFSTFSEQLEPEKLVELMVEYLSEMTDIITDQGGTLDKYIGDAIDAMYGAPLPLSDHAHRGVLSTVLMQKKQAELCAKWQSQGKPDLVQIMRTRIGLNSGVAVVGNMGSQRRFNYTMMGDNVNLGARCESGAKAYGVYTMITDETRKEATETKDNFTYRYLDYIGVKGREHPVKVHEVMGFTDEMTPEVEKCIELYETALEKYIATEWDAARNLFVKASELEPFQPDRDPGVATNPSRVMAARCGLMKADPPPPDWDGVFRMTSK